MSAGPDHVRSTDNGEPEVVLSARGITKVYPGTVALKDADFDVRAGSVNVLVGENGAGKSTLMKVLAGVEQPTDGVILIDGAPVAFSSTLDAARSGVGIVFQEMNLFPNLSVAENIFMSREIVGRFGQIDRAAQERRTTELMARLEHDIAPRTAVGDLPIGQQQIVEIAKALSQDARVLIMDEPTSALSKAEVEILFRVIGELKSQGVAIVYISHRLEELVRIGDFITVLRNGEVTGQSSMADVDVPWIVRQMIGSDAKDFATGHGKPEEREIFRAEDISLPGRGGGLVVDHVSLSLCAGEILGIYGLMGAGRSELLECIIGRHPHAKGKIYLDGKRVPQRSVAARIARGIALIPEDRQRDGLVPILPIATNMTLASLGRYCAGHIHLLTDRENAAVRDSIANLSIKAPYPANPVSSLSGGNQQKVVIAKGLMTDPRVLLMDEPSRGIDVGAKVDVFRTMRRLAGEGLGIIFVTSDLEEVMALSDRIAVMSNGKLVRIFDIDEATEEGIVAASAVGRSQPHDAGDAGQTHRQEMTA